MYCKKQTYRIKVCIKYSSFWLALKTSYNVVICTKPKLQYWMVVSCTSKVLAVCTVIRHLYRVRACATWRVNSPCKANILQTKFTLTSSGALKKKQQGGRTCITIIVWGLNILRSFTNQPTSRWTRQSPLMEKLSMGQPWNHGCIKWTYISPSRRACLITYGCPEQRCY